MSDALTPLRQVYGLEPDLRAETPEYEALRGLREVLDARPPQSPPPDVLEAVLARAAEPPDALTFASDAQAAALAPVLDALDRLPRPAPSASVIAAVEARAADAAGSLSAVRHVYAGAPAPAMGTPASVEAEMLHQSREAIDRSHMSRPQAQPAPEVVDAILARAAEIQTQDEEIPAQSAVEAAVIAQSLQALDRLPRLGPSVAALDAVLAAAAIPPSAPPDADRQRPAAPARDRAPARARRRPVGVWAGASALVMAVAVAVMMWPGASVQTEAVASLAVADQAGAVESAPAAPSAPAPLRAADPVSQPETAPSGSALAAGAAIAGFVPVVPPPAPRPAAPTPQPTAASQAESAASVSRQAASAPPPTASTGPPPSWEASDDVRALSLRLQELDDDALGWDTPAEAFGAPASALTATPGVQAVGAVRARARVIDSNDQR